MNRISFVALLLFGLLLAPARSLGAGGHLFVFDGGSPSAAVYEADSLRLAATPSVGLDARAAFGFRTASGGEKFYVVTGNAVVVLNERLEAEQSIPLPVVVSPASHAAALSQAWNRLVIAAGEELLLIDTQSDQIVAQLEPGFPPAGVVVIAEQSRAYITSATDARLRALDLESGSLVPGILSLPQAPQAVAVPGRSLNVLFANGSAIYDFRTSVGQGFRPGESPGAGPDGPGAIEKLAATDGGRFYFRRGGALYAGSVREGEQTAALRDPASGLPLGASLADFAVSAAGSELYLAFSAPPRLVQTDGNGESVMGSASLFSAPSSIVLVEPAAKQSAGMLEAAGPTSLTAAAGFRFELSVRALDAGGLPQAGIPVFASNFDPTSPMVVCYSELTNQDGLATLECESDTTGSARTIQITLSDGEGRSAPPFPVRLEPPTETEGLAKISGDNERVSIDGVFRLTVRATENRLPQADVDLTIRTSVDPPIVSCPSQAVTGEDGFAVIECTTDEVDVNTNVTITVTDEFGRQVEFLITIDLNAILSNGISKVSGDGQIIGQGQEFRPLVVAYFLDGEPQVDAQLRANVSPQGAIECPLFVRTDEMGFAEIRCRASFTFGQTTAMVFVSDDFGRRLRNPFTLIVRMQGGPSASTLFRNDEGTIMGPVGVLLEEAVNLRAVNDAGQGVPDVEIHFDPADEDLTFIPEVPVTNDLGNATASLMIGCGSGSRGNFFAGIEEGRRDITIPFRGDTGPLEALPILQGNNQTGVPGQRLTDEALVVQAVDFCGNPIPGVEVDWSVRPRDGASLRNVIPITDSRGRSSVLADLGQRGGPVTVIARSGEFESQFTLNVLLDPAELVLRSGNRQMVSPGQFAPQPLVVQVLGTNGSTVTAVPVTFGVVEGQATLSAGSAETDGLGIAFTRVRAGTSPGAIVVEAAAFGQTVRFFLNDSAPVPMIPANGFVDGGSFRPGFIPGGTGSIFGVGITTNLDGVLAADSAPFPLELGGVKVFINGVQVPIISVSNVNGAEQINFQIPFNIPAPGSATVVVDNNGSQATFEGISVLPVRPGIFQLSFAGFPGQVFAAALHADFRLVTPEDPAQPGEVILLFLTGLGPTDPPVATNTAGPASPLAQVTAEVTVRIDGGEQEHLGSFYAPGLITAYQTNFRVAEGAEGGNRVLTVEAGGESSQQVLLPIAAAEQ